MPPKRSNHRTTQHVDRDMTDEEIDALMNQPLTFFRSGGGWAARATNEAQMVASLAAARQAAEARATAEARAAAATREAEEARATTVWLEARRAAKSDARTAAAAGAAETARGVTPRVGETTPWHNVLDRRMR